MRGFFLGLLSLWCDRAWGTEALTKLASDCCLLNGDAPQAIQEVAAPMCNWGDRLGGAYGTDGPYQIVVIHDCLSPS